MSEREILARYHAMKRWVERERRRLARTRGRPSQKYLRRSRIVDDTDPVSLRDLLRELQTVTTRKAGRGC